MEVDDIDARLDSLLAWFERRRKLAEIKRKAREAKRLLSLGLREPEAQAWLNTEPDFKKQITEPLDRKRKGRAMLAMLLLALAAPHIFLPSSPNGLLQHQKIHVPNEELTLPGVT